MSAWLRRADLMQHSITLCLGQKHFSEPGGMFPVAVFLKNMFVPTEHKQAGCTCTLNQLFNLVSKSHIVCSEPYVCKMYEVRRGRKRHNEKKRMHCARVAGREKQTEKAWVSCSSSQVKKQTKKQTPIKASPHSKLEAGPASQKNGISTACGRAQHL